MGAGGSQRGIGARYPRADHLLDFAHDAERAEQFVETSRYSGGRHRWAKALIACKRGDYIPLRSLVEEWVARRENRHFRAHAIEAAYYRLGDYGEHMRWFAVREAEKDGLAWVPMYTLRDHPDYWDRLTEWAIGEPREVRSLMALVNGHRARIDRITEKMVLATRLRRVTRPTPTLKQCR